jgi:RNA polymerase sigma-70 factor (ECF subfamily)
MGTSRTNDLTARFSAEVLPNVDQLHRVARRYTDQRCEAEDLVQETLTKAWAGFASFTPDTNIRGWLIRIMVNTAITNFRRAGRRPAEVLADAFTDGQLGAHAGHTSSGLPSAEDQALALIADETVVRALAGLPGSLRAAVWYADVEGLKYREIAVRVGVPVGTVMSRVHRGRTRLRFLLPDMAERRGWDEVA